MARACPQKTPGEKGFSPGGSLLCLDLPEGGEALAKLGAPVKVPALEAPHELQTLVEVGGREVELVRVSRVADGA